MAKKKQHRFGEVCRLLDVQPYVLRYWETEFPALANDEETSGQRTYSEDHLAVIRRIKELLYSEGFTLVGAKKKLQAELVEGTLQVAQDDVVEAVDASSAGDSGEEVEEQEVEAPEADPEPLVEDEPDEEATAADSAQDLVVEDDEPVEEGSVAEGSTVRDSAAEEDSTEESHAGAEDSPVEDSPDGDSADDALVAAEQSAELSAEESTEQSTVNLEELGAILGEAQGLLKQLRKG